MLAARAYPDQSELRLENVEKPRPGVGEVIVKVESAGFATGILSLWQAGKIERLPATLGHEIAGTVDELGAEAVGFDLGARVRIHPNLVCRECRYCRSDREMMCESCSMIGHAPFGPKAMPMYERYHNGGLAEYVLAPTWLLDPIGDLSFDVAAKVHDIADALRALKVSAVEPGGTLVIGAATGAMGVSTIVLAKAFGIGRVIAVGRTRANLEGVKALAPALVETLALEDLDEGWEQSMGLTRAIRALVPAGADAVLDYFPQGPGSWQAIAAMKTGGTAVTMGGNVAPPPLPTVALTFNCWRIVGSRNCSRDDAQQVIQMLQSGLIEADDLITHTIELQEVNRALEISRRRAEPAWMVVIRP